MGTAIDTVVGTVTAPGATLTAATAATGDSFAVRNTNPGVDIWLLSMWGFNNVAGVHRLHSPRMHDNVQGIRGQVIATTPEPIISPYPNQRLFPQDVLIYEISGSGVGGNIESGILMVYYADLPGIAGRFLGLADLKTRGANVLTVEVDVTPGVGGGYTGSSALNKNFDVLKANTDYAVLGASFSATVGAATLKGADTGNLRIPIPGLSGVSSLYWTWFVHLTRYVGLNLIPIVNSANKAGTFIEGVASQAGTAFNVSLNLVELAPAGAAPVAAAPAVR